MTYTYFGLIEEVLKEKGEPKTICQIWKYANEKGICNNLASMGKTPEKIMNAQLNKKNLRGEKTRFKQVRNLLDLT